MILSTQNELGEYTCVSATGILCNRVSRDHAFDAILTAVEDIPAGQVENILDQQSDPALFRSTWSDAVSAELESMGLTLEGTVSQAELTEVRQKLATVTEVQDQILAAMEKQELERDQKRFDRQREAEYWRNVDLLAKEFKIPREKASSQFGALVIERMREVA